MLYVVLQALASSYMYLSTYLPSFIVKKKQPQKKIHHCQLPPREKEFNRCHVIYMSLTKTNYKQSLLFSS